LILRPHEKLELDFSKLMQINYAVACNSGTAALQLAMEALQLPPGSEVIVPEFTMIACARAVSMAGLTPVFADCNELLLIDDKTAANAYSPKVRAIMPVHIYGRQCNMNSLHEFAKRRELAVIEDMSEIHGIKPHPDSVAACWSFYRNKIVCGEEGGLAGFKYEEHAKLARSLRCQGFTAEHDFLHVARGINARLSDTHASLILTSLDNLQHNLAVRRQLESLYDEYVPKKMHMPKRKVCWVYDVRLGANQHINGVVQRINKAGYAARHGFKPMSMQPEYSGVYSHLQAYAASRNVMYLPVMPGMPEESVAEIASLVYA